MFEMTFIMEWLEFAVRWLHVIAAMAWIGSSFYFIALDLGLRPSNDRRQGVLGEEWQVHGGGFYHIQKYVIAPARMPHDLVWFKWESYTTWLSGFAMLILVYYLGGELYLIDPNVLDIPVWQGVLISLGSLGFGWIIYDLICKSRFGDNNTRLMIFLFFLLMLMAWGYTQVFTGRAALLHLGAFTATIMTGNVFVIIMPNQRVVVKDLIAEQTPDAKYGKIAKQRSTHNNYLTLPVIFLMLSTHYPLAFASEMNWLIAGLVFLMGVSIRHYFNTKHARKGTPNWTWAITFALFVLIMWLSTAPMFHDRDQASLGPAAERFATAEGFEEVQEILLGRCSMCHAQEVYWEGLNHAPKAVFLDTPFDVARQARAIYMQAGVTNAMPPANLTYIEPEERAAIRAWYHAATNS